MAFPRVTDNEHSLPPQVSAASGAPIIAVFSLLSVFLIGVLLLAPLSVTQDGYSHLYGAHVLRAMWRGDPDFRAHFYYNSFLVPNWLGNLILAALQFAFSDTLALKLLMILTAGALFCSLYYFLDTARIAPRQRAQTLIILLPFAINGYLTKGFYGFVISSALCMYIAGRLLRGLFSGRHLLVVSFVLLIAYFFHPVPVLLALIFYCSWLLAGVLNAPGGGWQARTTILRHHSTAFAPWGVPMALMLWFYVRLRSSHPRRPFSLLADLKLRTINLLGSDALLDVSPSPASGTLFVALLGILAAVALIESRRALPDMRRRMNTLAIFLAASFILYFLAPNAVGDGGEIANRVLLYSVFSLVLLALGTIQIDNRVFTLCSAISVIVVLFFGFEYLLISRRMSPAVAELQSSTANIPSHSRVVILSYRLTPACKGWPLLERALPSWHWGVSVAAAKDLIVLNDYEGTTSHFPLRYRSLQFAPLVNGFDPAVDTQTALWNGILSQSDLGVDYVLSWGVPSGVSSCPGSVEPPFEQTLRRHFDLVASTAKVSRTAVWKRRP